jgi:prevent-host-death family protein
MIKTISKSQFKPKCLQYFREVQETGREIIITDHGQPVLKLTPFSQKTPDILASLRNTILEYHDPLEPVGVDDWEVLS